MRSIILLLMVFTVFGFAQHADSLTSEIAIRQSLLEESGVMSGIAGAVIDAVSKKPIGKVRIEILGTSNIVLTGPDGQYSLTVMPGYYQVLASANGYESELKNNVRVKNDTETELFFSLRMDNSNPPDFVPVDKQPQPITGNTPAPNYPELGRKIKMEGMVWVKLLVNEEGNVTKVDVIRESYTRLDSIGLLTEIPKSDEKRIREETYKAKDEFTAAATSAAMLWKFNPAVMNGQKVKVWVSIPFKFKLDTDKKPTEGKSQKKK